MSSLSKGWTSVIQGLPYKKFLHLIQKYIIKIKKIQIYIKKTNIKKEKEKIKYILKVQKEYQSFVCTGACGECSTWDKTYMSHVACLNKISELM